MKKLGIYTLALFILLSGCSNDNKSVVVNNKDKDTSRLNTHGKIKYRGESNDDVISNIQYSDDLINVQSEYESFLDSGINANIIKGRYYYQYNNDIVFSDEYFFCYPILEESNYSGISIINERYKEQYETNKTNYQKKSTFGETHWPSYHENLKGKDTSRIGNSSFTNYNYSTVSVEYVEPYVNIIFIYNSYYGGAHPISYYSSETYDMRNGELLELEDVFSDFSNDKERLQTLLQSEAEEIVHNPDLIKLDNWYDKKTDLYSHDFIVSEDGIEFLFDDYEIGAYAEGKQNITLKYSDIKQYLNIEFIESLAFEI